MKRKYVAIAMGLAIACTAGQAVSAAEFEPSTAMEQMVPYEQQTETSFRMEPQGGPMMQGPTPEQNSFQQPGQNRNQDQPRQGRNQNQPRQEETRKRQNPQAPQNFCRGDQPQFSNEPQGSADTQDPSNGKTENSAAAPTIPDNASQLQDDQRPEMPGTDRTGNPEENTMNPPANSSDQNSENKQETEVNTDSEVSEDSSSVKPADGQMPSRNMEKPAVGQMTENRQNGSTNGQPPAAPSSGTMPTNGQGNSSAPTEYAAANTMTEDSENASYSSTSDGENAILVDGKTVSVSGAVIEKSGNSDGEDSDFYGTNAAVLANNGSSLTITDATITTDGTHANGVFSYGSGTTVIISDSAITTTGNNSGGLMTTGGATMNASNLTVNTSGNSSAAIRSDRGGGTVTVDKGTYNTSGKGSPAIYSTADITVSDADLSASDSEAVVIEGGNSVTLNNVNISGNDATLNGQSTTKTNVLIYQSMSGDASEGNSSFTMTGGSMTSETGTMFHVTNITTTISLSDVTLNNAEDSDDLMILSADSWGTSGKNGGNATVYFSKQTASGNIIVDEVSSLSLNLKDGSSYTGSINNGNFGGTVSVTMESGSTWTLTGDSYLTSFEGNLADVNLNGYTLYVNGTALNA